MKWGLFSGGAFLLIFGFAVVAYDAPRADLILNAAGGLALINEDVRESYQSLQTEIFVGWMMVITGIVVIIPSVVLGRKKN